MAFVAYFIVITFTACLALFGLDLITSPLPPGPGSHIASTTTASNKLERRTADAKAMKQAGKPGTLSPLYPDRPGEKVAPANPATRDETTAALAKADDDTGTTNKSPTTSATTGTAREGDGSSDLTDAAQATAGHCDVAACSAAYHSFRASDCTFQPYEGPRRACTATPQAQRTAQRTPARQVTQREYTPRGYSLPAPGRRFASPPPDDQQDALNYDDDSPPFGDLFIFQRPRW